MFADEPVPPRVHTRNMAGGAGKVENFAEEYFGKTEKTLQNSFRSTMRGSRRFCQRGSKRFCQRDVQLL